jgi:hypothetical protein
VDLEAVVLCDVLLCRLAVMNAFTELHGISSSDMRISVPTNHTYFEINLWHHQ